MTAFNRSFIDDVADKTNVSFVNGTLVFLSGGRLQTKAFNTTNDIIRAGIRVSYVPIIEYAPIPSTAPLGSLFNVNSGMLSIGEKIILNVNGAYAEYTISSLSESAVSGTAGTTISQTITGKIQNYYLITGSISDTPKIALTSDAFEFLTNTAVSSAIISSSADNASFETTNILNSGNVTELSSDLLISPSRAFSINGSSTIGNLILEYSSNGAIQVNDKLLVKEAGIISEITILSLTSSLATIPSMVIYSTNLSNLYFNNTTIPLLTNMVISANSINANANAASFQTFDYISVDTINKIVPSVEFTPGNVFAVDPTSTIGNLKLNGSSLITGDKLLVEQNGTITETVGITLANIVPGFTGINSPISTGAGPLQSTTYMIGSDRYVSFGNLTACTISSFKWTGTAWIAAGADPSTSPNTYDLCSYMIGPDTYLSTANDNGSNTFNTFKWNGTAFISIGAAVASGGTNPHGICQSTIGTDSYISIANFNSNRITIFKWNGTAYASFGSVATGSLPQKLISYEISGESYISVGNITSGTIGTYKWNGTAFASIGADVATSAQPYNIKYFMINSEHYILTSGNAALNFATHKWNGTTWVSIGSALAAGGANYPFAAYSRGTSYYVTFCTATMHTFKWNGTGWDLLINNGTNSYPHYIQSFSDGGNTYVVVHDLPTSKFYTYRIDFATSTVVTSPSLSVAVPTWVAKGGQELQYSVSATSTANFISANGSTFTRTGNVVTKTYAQATGLGGTHVQLKGSGFNSGDLVSQLSAVFDANVPIYRYFITAPSLSQNVPEFASTSIGSLKYSVSSTSTPLFNNLPYSISYIQDLNFEKAFDNTFAYGLNATNLTGLNGTFSNGIFTATSDDASVQTFDYVSDAVEYLSPSLEFAPTIFTVDPTSTIGNLKLNGSSLITGDKLLVEQNGTITETTEITSVMGASLAGAGSFAAGISAQEITSYMIGTDTYVSVSNAGSNTFSTYKWNGTTFVSIGAAVATGATPLGITAYLIGSDNYISIANNGATSFSTYKWNGTTFVSIGAATGANTNPQGICSFMIGSDNYIAVANNGAGTISVFKWNGTTFIGYGISCSSAHSLVAYTINSDTYLSVIQTAPTNTMITYKWNGTTFVSIGADVATGVAPVGICTYLIGSVQYISVVSITGSDIRTYKWDGTSFAHASTSAVVTGPRRITSFNSNGNVFLAVSGYATSLTMLYLWSGTSFVLVATSATTDAHGITSCIIGSSAYIATSSNSASNFSLFKLIDFATSTVVTSPSLSVAVPTWVAKGGQELQYSVSATSTPSFVTATSPSFTRTGNVVTKTYAQATGLGGTHVQLKVLSLNLNDQLSSLRLGGNLLLNPMLNTPVNGNIASEIFTATSNNASVNASTIGKYAINSLEYSFEYSPLPFSVNFSSTIGSLKIKSSSLSANPGDSLLAEQNGVISRITVLSSTMAVIPSSISAVGSAIATGTSPYQCVSYMIGSDNYISVANYGAHTFSTYKWNGTTFASIGAAVGSNTNPFGICFFRIGADYYVANTCAGTSKTLTIFKWTGSAFLYAAPAPGTGAEPRGIVPFIIDGTQYIATVQTTANTLAVFKWNGTAFVAIQTISSLTGVHWITSIMISSVVYIMVSLGAIVKTYKWNGTSFISGASDVTTADIYGITSYVIGSDTYISTANGSAKSISTFKWNGTGWISIGADVILPNNAANIAVYPVDTDTLLSVTVSTSNIIRTFKWNGTTWISLNLDVSTASSPYGICSSLINGERYISCVNQGGNSLSVFKVILSGNEYTITSPSLSAAVPTWVGSFCDHSYTVNSNLTDNWLDPQIEYFRDSNNLICKVHQFTTLGNVVKFKFENIQVGSKISKLSLTTVNSPVVSINSETATGLNGSNIKLKMSEIPNETVIYSIGINATSDAIDIPLINSNIENRSHVNCVDGSAISSSNTSSFETLEYTLAEDILTIQSEVSGIPSTVFTINPTSTVGNLILSFDSPGVLNSGDNLIVDTGTEIESIDILNLTRNYSALLFTGGIDLGSTFAINSANIPTLTNAVISGNNVIANADNALAQTFDYVSSSDVNRIYPGIKFTPNTFGVKSTSAIGNLILSGTSLLSSGNTLLVEQDGEISEISNIVVTTTPNLINKTIVPLFQNGNEIFYIATDKSALLKVDGESGNILYFSLTEISNVTSMVYFNSRYFAANGSSIKSSSDLVNWTTVYTITDIIAFSEITCSPTALVVSWSIGASNSVATPQIGLVRSVDGILFSLAQTFSGSGARSHQSNYHGSIYQSGIFAIWASNAGAGGAAGAQTVVSTDDGLNWISHSALSGTSDGWFLHISGITNGSIIGFLSSSGSMPAYAQNVWRSWIAGTSFSTGVLLPVQTFNTRIVSNINPQNGFGVLADNSILLPRNSGGFVKTLDGITFTDLNTSTSAFNALYEFGGSLYSSILNNATSEYVVNAIGSNTLRTYTGSGNTYSITSPSLSVAVPTWVAKGGQTLQYSVSATSTPSFVNATSPSFTRTGNIVTKIYDQVAGLAGTHVQLKGSGFNSGDSLSELSSILVSGAAPTFEYTITSPTLTTAVPLFTAKFNINVEYSVATPATPAFMPYGPLTFTRAGNLLTGTTPEIGISSPGSNTAKLKISNVYSGDKITKISYTLGTGSGGTGLAGFKYVVQTIPPITGVITYAVKASQYGEYSFDGVNYAQFTNKIISKTGSRITTEYYQDIIPAGTKTAQFTLKNFVPGDVIHKVTNVITTKIPDSYIGEIFDPLNTTVFVEV